MASNEGPLFVILSGVEVAVATERSRRTPMPTNELGGYRGASTVAQRDKSRAQVHSLGSMMPFCPWYLPCLSL